MSPYKHLNSLLHKKKRERIDATAHPDNRLFNKSDRAKRGGERERVRDGIIYSTTMRVVITMTTKTKLRISN